MIMTDIRLLLFQKIDVISKKTLYFLLHFCIVLPYKVIKITYLTSKALYKIKQKAINWGFNLIINYKTLAIYI